MNYQLYPHMNRYLLLILSFILLFIQGCSTVKQKQINNLPKECYTVSDCQEAIADPWENVNRKIFAFNEYFDTYILKPIAIGYDFITPKFVQRGIDNFYKNLGEPITAVNALLQGKGNQSGVSFTRFLYNSTIGLGGLLDVAGEIGLERFDENFNQTLAVWGVESGNYIVIPFLGSSSIRGGGSLFGDSVVDPLFHYGRGDDGIADPYTAYTSQEGEYSLGIRFLNIVNTRRNFLKKEKDLLSGNVDRYSFFRRVYFLNLRYRIYDGKVPEIPENKDTEEELEELLQ